MAGTVRAAHPREMTHGTTRSPWQEHEFPRFAPLARDIQVDIVVVGGGIAGATAAHLLTQAGRRVALIERGTLVGGDTGHTTDAVVTHRWLGQVIETDDGLPFIGEHAEREFIATGFAGNGMTFGTLAGMMARDAVLGQRNPWIDLFRVDRKPFHGGLWQYVRENLDYPWYLVKDRLGRADAGRIEDVPAGEGRIVALDEGRCAVHRAGDGTVTVCSAVCTHLGCLVRWNAADRSWDCPCHGSRFAPDGAVLSGPATAPLRRLRPA